MSKAESEQYIANLPEAQRAPMKAALTLLRKNVPKGYKEYLARGMGIMFAIPFEDYPDTYNGQPLMYVAVAAQKNYCSLYLMSAYGQKPHLEALKAAYKEAGKKLDMGKSCIHFRSVDDLEQEVIGKLVSSIPPVKWIEIYESSRRR